MEHSNGRVPCGDVNSGGRSAKPEYGSGVTIQRRANEATNIEGVRSRKNRYRPVVTIVDPYVAVIFTSTRTSGDDGYAAMADRMEELAAAHDGYRGIESARQDDGFGITVSYWANETSAAAWKQEVEHLEAQRIGRARWYRDYSVRIATVTREYHVAD